MPNADLYVGKKKENNNERGLHELACAKVVRKNDENEVAGRSRDRPLAFKQLFLTFQPK